MSQWNRMIKTIDSLRRSLWPVGIFRDVSRGTFLERAAAYRHNRAARGCLPRYMNNWLMVAAVLSTAAVGLENANNLPAAVLCWVLVAYTATELAVLSAIYLLLTAWES
jgi:hypothetical protein